MQGQARVNTLEVVGPITRSAHQLAHSHNVHPGLLLGVGVLHQRDLGFRFQVRHLGQLDEIVDALAVELQVEASILESAWQLNDRLPDILDLLLAGNLMEKRLGCFYVEDSTVLLMSTPTITWIL